MRHSLPPRATSRATRKTFSLIPLITPRTRATPSNLLPFSLPVDFENSRTQPRLDSLAYFSPFPRDSIFHRFTAGLEGSKKTATRERVSVVIGRGVKAPFAMPRFRHGCRDNLEALSEISSTRRVYDYRPRLEYGYLRDSMSSSV